MVISQTEIAGNSSLPQENAVSTQANAEAVLPGVAVPPETREQVLIAEDSPMYRRILEGWLRNWGFCVVSATDGERAWEILQQETAPNLLILDWMMPGFEGTELCRKVRNQQRSRYAYILLITSRNNKEDIVRGLEAGADDYVTKPFSVAELQARVNVGRRILTLQDELIRAREELRFGATHDWLTGLWNRGASSELLARELERTFRHGAALGVLMVDIDHFKNINDTYGHPAGDLVLREVAKRVAQGVRSYDLVGRYGGEEFLVVVSDSERAEILEVAERVRRSVMETPIVVPGAALTATVSVGAAVSDIKTKDPESLTAGADKALYAAKENGRNRVEIAPPDQV